MHSPNRAGPAMALQRPEYYTQVDTGPPPKESSSKILHSLLYNFAHSGYLNSPPSETGRCENGAPPTGEHRRPPEPDLARDMTQTSPDYSHNCRSNNDMVAPLPRQHTQRQLPYACTSVMESSSHVHVPRAHPGQSTSMASPSRGRDGTTYPESYLSPRHRSSSIGSAGSSFRDSRSPSHDSTASHDSLSRGSPLSIASSPSPSPPTLERNNSKLFGILKGASYTSPYGIPTGRTQQSDPANRPGPSNQRRFSSTSDQSSSSSHHAPRNGIVYSDETRFAKCDPPRTLNNKLHSPSDYGRHKRPLSQCQDEPIDLSCKPKKKRLESCSPCDSPYSLSRRFSWGSEYHNPSNDGRDPSDIDSLPRRSILESILCATKDRSETGSPSPMSTRKDCFPFDSTDTYRSSSESKYSMSGPTSPVQSPDSPFSNSSLPISMPPSPVLSIGSQYGVRSPRPRCPWRQQVTLAKKNLYPIRARVSDWFQKIMAFAKSQQEFTSLPDTDKVTLIQHAWTRLMLICMAENNFHCVVTPVHEDFDDGRPPAITGIDPTEPTMDSVEAVQNFIRKCQTLGLESAEYAALRMVTLFHTGCPGLENPDFVDKISSKSRQSLQDTVHQIYPGDKLRYSSLLLCLHTVFGVNCGMVQNLFCKHLANGGTLENEVKELILKRDAADEEPDKPGTNETETPQTWLDVLKI